MDKTININIAGTLFKIDEEAYRILRDYLQTINNRFKNVQGGHETIDDIESRIAEIFQSQKGLAGVISKENVEGMILIIGKPEDFDHTEPEVEIPTYSYQRKRMYRNPDDSIISGVCGGIGAYLNTDPLLFRILFAVFTLFGGIGFFVYVALWISLTPANTDSKKREMYGNAAYSPSSKNRRSDGSFSRESSYSPGYYNTSRIGNAFDEVFRAVGRVLYLILRIFLIVTGVVLVLTGFLLILSFVMIFVFKYPGAFSANFHDNLFINFPSFLNYIVNPAIVPWIIGLTIVAILLPLSAIIYWGVKMIFWFKARDGIVSLVCLVLWVLTITTLAIIISSEGVSFARSARTTSQYILQGTPDTIYVMTNHKVSDLKYDKEFSLPDNEYSVFINDEKKELYIRPHLHIGTSQDNLSKVELKKQSSDRTKSEAIKRTEELKYNLIISGDTLHLDEYFTIPEGRRWATDNIDINLSVHEGTIIKFDHSSVKLNHSYNNYESDDDSDSISNDPENRTWVLTEDGLKPIDIHPPIKK